MQTTLGVDHYLVARVQALTTGATAHDVYQLLGCYYELVESGADSGETATQLQHLERRLRAFCMTGRVPREV